MVHHIDVGIAVVEHLINGAELDLIVAPDLIRKRLLGYNLTDVASYIIEGFIFRVLRITERKTQAARRTVRQLHEDRLRVSAHVMPHQVTIRRIFEHFDGMSVGRYIRAHELAAQAQSAYRPTAPIEAYQLGYRVLLRVRGLETRQLELIYEERSVQPQMIRQTYRDGRKSL